MNLDELSTKIRAELIQALAARAEIDETIARGRAMLAALAEAIGNALTDAREAFSENVPAAKKAFRL